MGEEREQREYQQRKSHADSDVYPDGLSHIAYGRHGEQVHLAQIDRMPRKIDLHRTEEPTQHEEHPHTDIEQEVLPIEGAAHVEQHEEAVGDQNQHRYGGHLVGRDGEALGHHPEDELHKGERQRNGDGARCGLGKGILQEVSFDPLVIALERQDEAGQADGGRADEGDIGRLERIVPHEEEQNGQ